MKRNGGLHSSGSRRPPVPASGKPSERPSRHQKHRRETAHARSVRSQHGGFFSYHPHGKMNCI